MGSGERRVTNLLWRALVRWLPGSARKGLRAPAATRLNNPFYVHGTAATHLNRRGGRAGHCQCCLPRIVEEGSEGRMKALLGQRRNKPGTGTHRRVGR
jgi:hypothetical protein